MSKMRKLDGKSQHWWWEKMKPWQALLCMLVFIGIAVAAKCVIKDESQRTDPASLVRVK